MEKNATKKYTILVVDDNVQNLRILANILGEMDCEIGFAQNGEQALEFISEVHADIILLDVMMPGMDGFEVCRKIKMTPGYEDIPVIFITAKDGGQDIVQGFKVGAADYIAKPFNSAELKMRVNSQLKIRQQVDALEAANEMLEGLNEKLIMAIAELDKAASTDQLTGIWNRRSFITMVNQAISNAMNSKGNISMILIDVDHFKGVNDKHGHQAGDQVLMECVDSFCSCLSAGEKLARWGGEEFTILVIGKEPEGVRTLAENIRQTVERKEFTLAGKLTVSIGISDFREHDNIDTWMKRVDEALYLAKGNGRNCVEYI